MFYEPIKVTAKDEEDLEIVLALLQDALLPTVSIVFDSESKTMTLLANRFCWEIPEEELEGEPIYYRVHAGLLFKNVLTVHEKNIQHNEKNPAILSFLMGRIEKQLDGYFVFLYFAENAAVRLHISSIDCLLADIDEPWSTRSIPMHIEDDIIDEESVTRC
ncbi:MAG: hypothetical protein HEEMFOPI_00549 [Holosporales bacterium]